MIYYFDSHVPVCDYEWTHKERTINTKKDFFKKSALFKRICVSFFVSTELLQKQKQKQNHLCHCPASQQEWAVFTCSKDRLFPPNIQLKEVVTPKLALAYPRAAFVVLSLSLQGLFIL